MFSSSYRAGIFASLSSCAQFAWCDRRHVLATVGVAHHRKINLHQSVVNKASLLGGSPAIDLGHHPSKVWVSRLGEACWCVPGEVLLGGKLQDGNVIVIGVATVIILMSHDLGNLDS